MTQPPYRDLFRRMREHFPALTQSDGYILLDNAAGAQLPQIAIDRVTQHLISHNAQKGPVFAREELVQQAIYEVRAACADLMGTTRDRIALGLNATSLTQLVAHHLGRDLEEGDLILTSQIDHMANVWPWAEMATRGVRVKQIPVTADGLLDMGALKELLGEEPALIAIGWVSNATGTPVDLPEITRLAHEAGALVFVDCVAGAPHLPMDVTAWDVDFAVCSGYKIFGPHMGFLYINPARLGDWQLGEMLGRPLGAYDLGTFGAARLELGTQNHEGVVGFGGTLEYLEMVGRTAAALAGSSPQTRRERLVSAMEAIADYERALTTQLIRAISALPGVIIYGRPSVPILSFNLPGRRPADVARHLDEHRIEARCGNYLAIPQMTYLAPEFGGEAVRVSLVHYNVPEEIERLGEVLASL